MQGCTIPTFAEACRYELSLRQKNRGTGRSSTLPPTLSLTQPRPRTRRIATPVRSGSQPLCRELRFSTEAVRWPLPTSTGNFRWLRLSTHPRSTKGPLGALWGGDIICLIIFVTFFTIIIILLFIILSFVLLSFSSCSYFNFFHLY